ncbi:MAG: phosphoenolpyruvate--protein phosphotransferase [Levilactobacillus sp.]|uniref:phosphoenolpyruvate--protein phosphotransferase n=1 Tax=Levilactobacillus sp. TaxID=2767919 RepID=UPI0025851ADF|nr:phosphoenolpyruvate--protein phosphotransferase [Levilactobacillus sp.]MCH4123911.1 phosphoenolpyruvate--protein phosphotransferase [Levilactobacillus sp.]MCI1554009.1 phosphoenolpyruvate--protein phosphotransferase [Levilactobacillus sp.]MCI1599791.1 phosphoenolpyruvate--protein phosphotransferase [Levilactobacillus sp.]MCI1606952.1 phosphoenolpyruvate--protein phosphotransferase [Levilactobacillus sp.]
MRAMLKGIAASDGVACGRVYRFVEPDLRVKRRSITNLDYELNRFHQALEAAVSEVETIKTRATKNLGADSAQVFSAHIEMLQDPEFIGAIETQIKTEHINAEVALAGVAATYETKLKALTSTYMQERVSDLHDVTKRLTAHLLGVRLPDLALLKEPVVVVTHDLIPSDTVSVDAKYILGFVTDLGGRTSHSSILARSLNIPAVVGTQSATTELQEGATVIVNGSRGTVISEPTKPELAMAKQAMQDRTANMKRLATLRHHTTTSQDGMGVVLAANVGTVNDLPNILQNGAEAIGLMRTEFLYMDSDQLPTEDEQFVAYRRVVQSLAPRPVVIRTLDIGGDKPLPYLKQKPEANPFLGARAIRQSLAHQNIFRSQLRALLRASAFGNLRIMFPMIATLDELRQAKAIYDDERTKLTAAKVPMGKVKVGMMVEVPAAAMLADRFAQEVDFMSIGTNDLIGYTMAADRTNQDVGYLYQPYHPAILRLVDRIITAGHAAGIPVAMCGEMAGDPIAVPLLLGMGLDEFSMGAGSILRTRQLISQLNAKELQSLVETVLNSASTSQEVVTMVQAAVPDVLNQTD